MLWWEIVLIITFASFAIYILLNTLIKKKTNSNSCVSSCSSCPHYKECQKAIIKIKEELRNSK